MSWTLQFSKWWVIGVVSLYREPINISVLELVVRVNQSDCTLFRIAPDAVTCASIDYVVVQVHPTVSSGGRMG